MSAPIERYSSILFYHSHPDGRLKKQRHTSSEIGNRNALRWSMTSRYSNSLIIVVGGRSCCLINRRPYEQRSSRLHCLNADPKIKWHHQRFKFRFHTITQLLFRVPSNPPRFSGYSVFFKDLGFSALPPWRLTCGRLRKQGRLPSLTRNRSKASVVPGYVNGRRGRIFGD